MPKSTEAATLVGCTMTICIGCVMLLVLAPKRTNVFVGVIGVVVVSFSIVVFQF